MPAEKLWGAQTQRSLEHFSIGKDLIPREMITAYAILKKAAANANHAGKRLGDDQHALIVKVCDEILAGQHHDMFPLHVWMTGSGTQFNMNVNEVISNRCCQLAGPPLGSKTPVHPNDHVNMSQSSNDTFPVGDVHRRGGQRDRAAVARGQGAARCDRGQGQGMGQQRQDRPNAYAGRHADHARPGMVGLCRHAGGATAPNEMTAEISRADSVHVKWSLTVLDPQGQQNVETFDAVANGEFYPISSDTTAAFRLTGDTIQATFQGPAGQINTLTCTLAAGQRR
jgi:hypothetical protein